MISIASRVYGFVHNRLPSGAWHTVGWSPALIDSILHVAPVVVCRHRTVVIHLHKPRQMTPDAKHRMASGVNGFVYDYARMRLKPNRIDIRPAECIGLQPQASDCGLGSTQGT